MIDYQRESAPLVYEFLSYLQVERGNSPQSVYNYFLDLRMFFRYLLCRKQGYALDELHTLPWQQIHLDDVQKISRPDISSFLLWLTMEKKLNQRSVNRKIAVLKSFFQYLVLLEYINRNVMASISSGKIEKNLPKYLEETQIDALLRGVSGRFWIRDLSIILFMVSAGLRVSEVAGLQLSSLRVGAVCVRGKGKKERQVYLSQRTLDALEEYLKVRPPVAEESLFLSQQEKALSVRAMQKTVDKHFQTAGLQNLSCHTLRHTAATQLLKQGANLREIQEILGHESVSTTEIYTHVSNDALKKVAQGLIY